MLRKLLEEADLLPKKKEKEPSKRKLKKEVNTLENKIATLENAIKDELYVIFMEKLSEPGEILRYKKENTRLRKQNKLLKEMLKEGK